MVIKACAMALKNIQNQFTMERGCYHQPSRQYGVVAVEDGLVVPVLKFTDAMSLSQIGGSVRDLAGRKKTKTTAEGSTFTVSNLGCL
jgi:pyruvate dehydrogenase E2 component (dihydrolipoamide acetyltransferase)